jgi:antitoxin MazE
MQTALKKIGNSSGIVIPKTVLEQIGVKAGDKVDLSVEAGKVVLTPVKRRVREGWREASKALVAAGEDGLVWPEFGNLDDEKLEW